MKILDEFWLSFAACGVAFGGGSYAQLLQLIESQPVPGRRPAPPLPAGHPAGAGAAIEATCPAGRWRQWHPPVAVTSR